MNRFSTSARRDCAPGARGRSCGSRMEVRPRGGVMVRTEVAPGVHRVGHADVNCWLIEDDDGLTLVDAGLPAVWRRLGEAIEEIGRRPSELRALVLTHAHFDHVGVAERLRASRRLPVWVHEADAELAAH